MATDPQLVISHKFPEASFCYTERDVVLYALSVGACVRDAVDEKELKYVYHPDGQKFIQILNKLAIAGLHDKGKAAILELETTSYLKETGEVLCVNRSSVYLRGCGGFSSSSAPYSYQTYARDQSQISIPKSKPSLIFEDSTQLSQALLYRLSGDYNPLHSDPMVAKIAGFSRPILHGLCALGFAVRAIVKCLCKGDPAVVKSIFVRFLLHVYPGEDLVTEMWLDGPKVIFQTKVKERNRAVLSGVVVLKHISSSL